MWKIGGPNCDPVNEVEDEWQVVQSRKGKSHANQPSHRRADNGHLARCPRHGNSHRSLRDADEEQRLLRKLQKSLERVRSSFFFKTECSQFLENLLANARRGMSPHFDHSAVMGDFVVVPSGGSNSIEYKAYTSHFSDDT